MRSGKRALVIPIVVVAALLALRIAIGSSVSRDGSRGFAALIAAVIVTVILLAAAALIRIFAVPRFTMVPGRFQLFLEQLSCMADGLGRGIRAIGRGLAKFCVGIVKGFVAVGRALVTGIPALIRRISRAQLSKRTKRALAVWLGTVAVLLVLSIVVPAHGHTGDVGDAMRDAVLHEENYFRLFGLKANPGLIAAIVVNGILLAAAALIRIFAIPKFRIIPGRFQMLLEQMIRTLDGLAGSPETGKCTFVGAYVFAAGVYIFVGTLFELLGLQAVAANGASVTLPAPLSDVNAAICMGCQSYLVILAGGIAHAGMHGVTATLKEFSLPISMSFRLFGALLSGLLVTDLVYHSAVLSYGLPVIIGVMFTLLHALIQTYVLTMLVGMYYGEVSERPEPKPKKRRGAAAA